MQIMGMESILVVEDSLASRKMFCHLLSKAGYNVKGAANAGEVMDILKDFCPGLILMDILLPGLDGLSLARKLRSSAGTAEATIVALSGCTMASDIERALASGCSGFITKPIDPRTFVDNVRSHLSRRAGRSPQALETAASLNTRQGRPETVETTPGL